MVFKRSAKDSSPLYLQLARQLEQSIQKGDYRPDQALPSERQLAEQLGMSRATARAAIDQLVEQGRIVRKRGSGNYIAGRVAPRFEQPLSQLTSFSEELCRRGHTPSSRWLQRSVSIASNEEQLGLGLSPGARVARLERLRLADQVVMAYELSVLPLQVLPDPSQVEGSLYEYLAGRKQLPVRALQHIRACNAPAGLAERLGIAEREAVLFVTRIAYQASGQAVELTHSYCRSDYYDLVAEMRRCE